MSNHSVKIHKDFICSFS